jgi:hypothetical protein
VVFDPRGREVVGAIQVAQMSVSALSCRRLGVETRELAPLYAQSAIRSRYAAWKRQQPSWFTEDVIARIPDDFMPKAELDSLNSAAPDGRRRSSVSMNALELLLAPSAPAPALLDSFNEQGASPLHTGGQ